MFSAVCMYVLNKHADQCAKQKTQKAHGYLAKIPKSYTGEKTAFSVNGAGEI